MPQPHDFVRLEARLTNYIASTGNGDFHFMLSELT